MNGARKRDAPCHCGSGLKYRFCHYPIDNAGPQHRLAAAREAYSDAWTENASTLEAQGCYRWMADQLKPFSPKWLLDIGCGHGQGLLQLCNSFPEVRILSMDENRVCLKRIHKLLRSAGLNTEVIRRYGDAMIDEYSYGITFTPGRLRYGGQITLLEGDLLADQELNDFLMSCPKFDVITVWLIGTHQLRHQCVQLGGKCVTTPT